MPLWPKRKTIEKPTDDREALSQAFAELADDEVARAKRDKAKEKKKGLRRWIGWIDRRLIWGALIILGILVIDGVRRQNGEFYAEVIAIGGTVTLTDSEGATVPSKTGEYLTSGCEVITGLDGRAVLELADGSRIVVTENSQVSVTGLDYNRGADYRDHAFSLSSGRAMASVGDRFGANSEMVVGTPGSVASVRGTQFLVDYDPVSGYSRAACFDGMVHLTTNGLLAQPLTNGTLAYADPSGNLTPIEPVPDDIRNQFLSVGELALTPSEDPLLRRIEYPLNKFLDPLLSVLGIGKCSWAVLAADGARRSAAVEAGQAIWQDIETQIMPPARVDLMSLDGLTLTERRKETILKQLGGNRLEVYVTGNNSFVVLLRAKDRERTRFLVTPSGVQNVQDNEQPVSDAIRACGYYVPSAVEEAE